jgi:hypothetical protein
MNDHTEMKNLMLPKKEDKIKKIEPMADIKEE